MDSFVRVAIFIHRNLLTVPIVSITIEGITRNHDQEHTEERIFIIIRCFLIVMVGLPTTVIKKHVNTYGPILGFKTWAQKAYLRKTKSVDGINFFNKQWDVLIILDACRPDLMSEVTDEYKFVDTPQIVTSIGSSTPDWMPKTFNSLDSKTLKRTAYICANPFSDQFLDGSSFLKLDEVWKYAWDEEGGTVRPRPVTDRAIQTGRKLDYDRMVIHYLQPHTPFLSSNGSPALEPGNFELSDNERIADDWKLLARGERELSTVWSEYRENLRLVLNDVEVLLSNLNAESVIITSDHGNAVGEHGLYGHPGDMPIAVLREVPWCETTATDKRTHIPEDYDPSVISDNVEKQLQSLGYH